MSLNAYIEKQRIERDAEEKEFNEKKSAIEQQLLKAIDGQDMEVIFEAIMLVLHRILGTARFGSIFIGGK